MTRLSRCAASVVYAILAPAGVAIRLIKDPLGVSRAPERTNWRPVKPRPVTVHDARRLD